MHHSKIPLTDSHAEPPSDEAVFITEDDSGLALLGVFVVTEPDHYAILIERARRRHKCAQLHHIQFDFYTDYWVFVAFPIARITAVCEPETNEPAPTAPSQPATPAEPEPSPEPAPPPAPAPPPTPAPAPVPAPAPDVGDAS